MLKPPKTDSELWNAVREDNELAFTTLFDRYWERLFNTSYHYSKDREESEEIVHDIFLSLWNRRKSLEIITIENFLIKAVRYQIYKKTRAIKLLQTHLVPEHEASLSEQNNGWLKATDQDLLTELNIYLNQLPKRCKEIFQMSRLHQLSNQEIATQLGISKRTVENQITVALKYLRVHFKNIATFMMFIWTNFN
ncbi:MAG: RNA polymerase sigma-70 factor [Pyrinomonadaceae bacterium]|nr:RNA polymerase sigma-70 factor [Sphingobacteriaceae bacterium]